jgi:hypothetical protein
MAQKMTDTEWRAFVSHGTRIGKLSTVRADGSPHVTPIWPVRYMGEERAEEFGVRSSIPG